jgi:hypothetical protein
VQLRTHLRTILAIGTLFTFAVATPSSAEEATLISLGAANGAGAPSVMSAKSTRSLFTVAPLSELAAAAVQQASPSTTTPNNHQFGAGLRINGGRFGIGGTVRYFFYAGPLGVQAEISRLGYDLGVFDWNSTQFSAAAIYRFVEHRFEAPLALVPYAGGGLNFIHSNFDEDLPFFGEDDTSVGVLVFGGVELFFDRVPNLGVSGELTFTSNDDFETGFGSTSLGGPAFTAAAHWYFW